VLLFMRLVFVGRALATAHLLKRGSTYDSVLKFTVNCQ